MGTKLAVLIPVYNEPNGLETSLGSLVESSELFDVVVVDDGSNPPLSIDKNAYSFTCILLRSCQNNGIAAALNKGLGYILDRQYTYVARLDAWDQVLPDRLEKQVAFLNNHPNHAIIGCNVDFVDWHEIPLYHYGPCSNHKEIMREMRYRPSFIHPAVTIRSTAFRTMGFYREDYQGGEDYELFLRLLRKYKGANLPEVLQRVYLNPHGISISQRKQLIRTRLRLQLEHFDYLNPHSYWGVLRTSLLAIMPYQLLFAIKRLVRPATQ